MEDSSQDAFERDLEAIFEERASGFSSELRRLLQSLWVEGVKHGRLEERAVHAHKTLRSSEQGVKAMLNTTRQTKAELQEMFGSFEKPPQRMFGSLDTTTTIEEAVTARTTFDMIDEQKRLQREHTAKHMIPADKLSHVIPADKLSHVIPTGKRFK